MIWILPLALSLIRIGQAMYAAGTARSKNSAGAALRSLSDLCIATLAFWAVGAAILFLNPGLLFGWNGTSEIVFSVLIVVLIGAGSVSATLAERTRFPVILVAAIVLAGVIIPIAGHWAWIGWLPRFTDVGGASVAHISAGTCALIGSIAVGPREGKYNRDGSTTMIPGHNVPLSIIGIVTMIGGFVPYVMATTVLGLGRIGGSIPQAGMNALVCIAAAGMSAMAISRIRYGKADVGLVLLGALGGAVAITAAGGYIGSPAAFLTGAVVGVIVPLASVTLDLIAHIDDPAGAISVHLLGGLWGTLSAGLFLPGTFKERLVHFGAQLLGAVVIALLSAAVSFGTFYALKRTIGLRSKEADEFDGLDLAEHDIGAYPDFQQTMIKSYHLREA